jgi:xanthine/uracil permease
MSRISTLIAMAVGAVIPIYFGWSDPRISFGMVTGAALALALNFFLGEQEDGK